MDMTNDYPHDGVATAGGLPVEVELVVGVAEHAARAARVLLDGDERLLLLARLDVVHVLEIRAAEEALHAALHPVRGLLHHERVLALNLVKSHVATDIDRYDRQTKYGSVFAVKIISSKPPGLVVGFPDTSGSPLGQS